MGRGTADGPAATRPPGRAVQFTGAPRGVNAARAALRAGASVPGAPRGEPCGREGLFPAASCKHTSSPVACCGRRRGGATDPFQCPTGDPWPKARSPRSSPPAPPRSSTTGWAGSSRARRSARTCSPAASCASSPRTSCGGSGRPWSGAGRTRWTARRGSRCARCSPPCRGPAPCRASRPPRRPPSSCRSSSPCSPGSATTWRATRRAWPRRPGAPRCCWTGLPCSPPRPFWQAART
jgi:hypothetical protein